MTELLTESFCERCGTRYTFESGEPEKTRPSVKKARVLARGLKHFVLSDDSLETALAEGERDEDRERAELQLEAFHQTFNFCMDCRQYTCRDCWNETEGRCLSCAPAPGHIESAAAAWTEPQVDSGGRLEALLGTGPVAAPPPIDAWPLEPAFTPQVSDLGAAPIVDDATPPGDAEEAFAIPTEAAAVEAEASAAEAAPADEVEADDEPLLAPDVAAPRPPSLEAYLIAASAARAAALSAAAPEPAPEPALVTEPEPEPIVVEPAPEPEPAAAAEAEPAAAAEAEPVVETPPAPAPRPIFPPPVGGDAPRPPSSAPGWDIVAPDGGRLPPPSLRPAAAAEVRPAGWFAARTNASIWDASTADVVNRPGSGVQSCVSCGLPLSAAAHFCRRCGARQSA